MTRTLESFGVDVLAEYIRRRSHFPAELVEIERQMEAARRSQGVKCLRCKDRGAVMERGWKASLCSCEAAKALVAKDPDFIQRWNRVRSTESALSASAGDWRL